MAALISNEYKKPPDHDQRLGLTLLLVASILIAWIIKPNFGTRTAPSAILSKAYTQYAQYLQQAQGQFRIDGPEAYQAGDIVNQPGLGSLAQFHMPRVEMLGLRVRPHQNFSVQGIYGEDMQTIVLGEESLEVHLHLFGANGINENGKGDDYLSDEVNLKHWLQYAQAFSDRYRDFRFNRYIKLILPLLIIFAVIFYFIFGASHFSGSTEFWAMRFPYRIALTLGYISIFHILLLRYIPEMKDFAEVSHPWIGMITMPLLLIYPISVCIHVPIAVQLAKKHVHYLRGQQFLKRQICPRCNYDLRASIQDEFNCPECGLAIHREHVTLDALPGV